MSEITKEELLAMIDVQAKAATAMESIANSNRQISEQNKETVRLQSEIVKSIAEEREKCTANICIVLEKGLKAALTAASPNTTVIETIAKDTFWIKIIFGSIAFITAIVGGIMAFSHHLATVANVGVK
jgi:hypothetical protein